MALRPPLRILIFVFLIALFTYLPFVRNQLFWDDEQFIYNNQHVKNADIKRIFTTNTIDGAGELSNYYRPLTTLSFALDYQFWGANPIGFHLTNTLAHALAAVFVCLVIVELGAPWWLAGTLATIFALHPIQTEAVVYANSRGDSLYAFFGMLSVFALLRTFHQRTVTIRLYDLQLKFPPIFWAVLSVVAYFASILAKEIGIAIGGLLLIAALVRCAHTPPFTWAKIPRRVWLVLLVSATGALGYLMLRFTILQFQPALNLYGDTPYGTSTLVRLLTFSKSVWIYILLLLAPYPLHMERSIVPIESWRSVWPWLTILATLFLTVAGWREYQCRQTAWILAGIAWFFTMLAPVSGILPINGMLYEHWLYVPLVGFALALYGLVNLRAPNWQPGKRAQIIFALTCSIWLLLSWRQNYLWANPIRFYQYTLRFADTARLHNNLAMAYADQKRMQEAIDEYQRALALSTQYPQIYYNLGNAHATLGQWSEAEAAYQQAIELSPNFAPVYRNLIYLYTVQNRATDAAALQSRFTSVFGE